MPSTCGSKHFFYKGDDGFAFLHHPGLCDDLHIADGGAADLADDARPSGTPARLAALAERRSLEDIATPLTAAGPLSAMASGQPGGARSVGAAPA
jgi:hypothetical protein